jgi:hypothetical protein
VSGRSERLLATDLTLHSASTGSNITAGLHAASPHSTDKFIATCHLHKQKGEEGKLVYPCLC